MQNRKNDKQDNPTAIQELQLFVSNVLDELKAALGRWRKFADKYDIKESDTIKNYLDTLLGDIDEYLATAKIYKEVLEFLKNYPLTSQNTALDINGARYFLSQLQMLTDTAETVQDIKSPASLTDLIAAIENLLPLLNEHYINTRDSMLEDSYSLQSLAKNIDLPVNYTKTDYFGLLSPLSQDKFKRAIGICASFPPPVYAKLHEEVKQLQACETQDSSHKGLVTPEKLQKNILTVEAVVTKLNQLTTLPSLGSSIKFLAESHTTVLNESVNLPSLDVNTANITQSAETAQLVRKRAKSHAIRRIPSPIDLDSSGSTSPTTPGSDNASSPKADIFSTLYRKMSIKRKPTQLFSQDSIPRAHKPLPPIPNSELIINKPLPSTPRDIDKLEAQPVVAASGIKAKIRLFEQIADQYKPVVDQLDQRFNQCSETADNVVGTLLKNK